MVSKMKIKFILSIFFCAFIIWFIHSAFQPYTVKFSKDFYYDYETNSIFGNIKTGDIPPEIVDFSYNKKIVVVKQKPTSKYFGMYNCPEDLNYKNGIDEFYYWIILLKEKKVYGPMLLEEYNILCKEKNIQLKFENNKSVKKNTIKTQK